MTETKPQKNTGEGREAQLCQVQNTKPSVPPPILRINLTDYALQKKKSIAAYKETTFKSLVQPVSSADISPSQISVT